MGKLLIKNLLKALFVLFFKYVPFFRSANLQQKVIDFFRGPNTTRNTAIKGFVVIFGLIVIGGFSLLAQKNAKSPNTNNPENTFCSISKGGTVTNKMSLASATDIINNSACSIYGTPTTTNYCNTDTATWWIDIKPKVANQGCSPVCIVNIKTKTAKYDARCN